MTMGTMGLWDYGARHHEGSGDCSGQMLSGPNTARGLSDEV